MEKYFIAKIIWQIKIPTTKMAAEFDEQLTIVKAENAENAFQKATRFGQAQEESFINNKGQQVSWVFINVLHIKEITSFEDGMEICSQTINAPNAVEFIKEIHLKAELNKEVLLQKLN
jgi:hypothetical protein